MKKTLFACSMLLFFLIAVSAEATPITFTGSSGSLAASATFSSSGSTLTVVLTNTSSSDVLNPSEVLTALFFTATGNPTLTPVSALLSGGSTVFFGPDGGGNVGGEWAYANGLAGAPGGADEGISSAGFGLFGPSNNFPGANLADPIEVDGVNYGLLSAGDNTATGNSAVTGQFPLIKNQVTFTLSGLPGGFDPSTGITTVSFQYGTALTETNLPGTPPVPEPATMLLLGSGLIGLAGLARRKFKK